MGVRGGGMDFAKICSCCEWLEITPTKAPHQCIRTRGPRPLCVLGGRGFGGGGEDLGCKTEGWVRGEAPQRQQSFTVALLNLFRRQQALSPITT